MPIYRYKATDPQRALIRGTIAADTPRQARDQLRAQGMMVRRLDEQKQVGRRIRWSRWTQARWAHHWAMVVHELAMLLGGGIPLVEAIETVAGQQRGALRTVLLAVHDQILGGSSLAEALKERPQYFDPLTIALVEVGEQAGTLDQVLRQLADFKQRMLQMKDQVLTALVYPTFLLVFGTAATLFLMTYVMPPLLENLEESLDHLPWPTQIVKACSDAIVHYGIWFAAGLATVAFLLGLAMRTRRGRLAWHRVLLRIPLLGGLALKQSLARAALVIATLSRSGVVLTRALELAARSSDNVVVREALEHCAAEVTAGRDIAGVLKHSSIFPPLAAQIFSVGQETGRLEEMLEQLSADYTRQVSVLSARFAALLEPVLILVLAGLVGFVLLATILPILEAGNVL